MKITSLELTNLRALGYAEFEFKPGFNLIVGVNGAGKSTVLDAIRTCSSHLLKTVRRMPFNAFGFSKEDIHGEAPYAEAILRFCWQNSPDEQFLMLREWRSDIAEDEPENLDKLRREILDTTRPRSRLRTQLRELAETLPARDTINFYPNAGSVIRTSKLDESAPLVVHYGTSRSYYRDRKERSSASSADQAAYYEALGSSTLNIRLLAEWLRAQAALSSERPTSAEVVRRVQDAIDVFLPGYSNLRTDPELPGKVIIDQADIPISISQLSDGERSILALVVDLSKRLSQANPEIDDPVRQASAVVLIDEIDLHLHPQWQRKVVDQLCETFPNCQFIATTHSPQVIGEVPHEKIQKIEDGQVQSPLRSFGIDSSRVLEELMDTAPRNRRVEEQIGQIAKLVADGKRAEATAAIEALESEIGESDPEITRARTLLDFMEDDA